MRILMLSWEYPPVVVGGLGRHVHALSTELAAQGHDVTVISRADATSARTEVLDGVRVIRVEAGPPYLDFSTDLLGWTLALNHALLRAALEWWPTTGPRPVIHAHDWLVAHAAVGLARATRAALVSTIHATEAGRHQGWLPGPLNRHIHSLEWWLANNSARVIVCSQSMRAEISALYGVPDGAVVPNGIDPTQWAASRASVRAARQEYGGSGPLLVYTGRLEYEKGVHDLIAATPALRRRLPGLRVVIIGDGTQRDWLVRQVARHRVGPSVRFAGYLDHDTVAAVVRAADLAVLPSRYEPFGLVALEMAAAGTPLAVADTGGLAEFAADDRGATFTAGDPAALAAVIVDTLADPAAARRRARRARAALGSSYSWSTITAATGDIYRSAVRRPTRSVDEIPAPPPSNLFTGAAS